MLARLDAALVDSPSCFLSRSCSPSAAASSACPAASTGARAGAHDDRVMAMAIALAARAELLTRPRT